MDISAAAELTDLRLRAAREENDVPAIAYGLVLGGTLVHSGSVGAEAARMPTAQTPFRIASMTKSFTATTVLILRDRGVLALDDRLERWLSWASTIGLPSAAPPLTIRHLLTMTAGFPTDDPWGDRQESLPLADFDRLVEGGLSFCRPPGIDFEYSNLGYALLGRVIAQATGEDFRDVVADLVLQPLGMASSTFDVSAAHGHATGFRRVDDRLVEQPETASGAFSPMGGLWSTVEDLARWIAFHEAAWADDPAAGPLDRWSRREMQRPHVVADVDDADGASVHSYGFGLYVTDHVRLGRFVHHSGGYPGFGSHMRWHPDTRWGIVALGNRTYANMRKVCADVLAEIVDEGAHAARRTREAEALWPITERGMGVAETLLGAWDDALVDQHGAMNLDLDQPRDERRRAWQRLTTERGPFEPVSDTLTSRSPAHARWRMRGESGDVWLEVLMTPEREPRIQTLAASPADDKGES
ncbi:MAG: serine hydrolase domain-containing protein [Actinomycetota bacterium]